MPASVAIDEAVRLTKRYASPEAAIVRERRARRRSASARRGAVACSRGRSHRPPEGAARPPRGRPGAARGRTRRGHGGRRAGRAERRSRRRSRPRSSASAARSPTTRATTPSSACCRCWHDRSRSTSPTAFDDVPRPARARAPRHARRSTSSRSRTRRWYPLVAGGKRLRPLLCAGHRRGARRRHARGAAGGGGAGVGAHVLAGARRPAGDGRRRRCAAAGRRRTSATARTSAVLVGDALLNGAYGLVLERLRCPASRRAAVLAALFEGVDGMIAGQYLDVRPPTVPDEAWLRRMSALKTGRLIRASVAAGSRWWRRRRRPRRAYLAFAEELGAGLPDRRRRARRDGHRRAARQAGRLATSRTTSARS